MGIRYSIDRINRRLVTRADGLVTFPEINAHLDIEQRNRDLERAELIDARGATVDLTTEQVGRLVGRAAEMLRYVDVGPTAIVTDNQTVYGMARLYALLAEHAGIVADVFPDVESASHWLNQFTSEDDD